MKVPEPVRLRELGRTLPMTLQRGLTPLSGAAPTPQELADLRARLSPLLAGDPPIPAGHRVRIAWRLRPLFRPLCGVRPLRGAIAVTVLPVAVAAGARVWTAYHHPQPAPAQGAMAATTAPPRPKATPKGGRHKADRTAAIPDRDEQSAEAIENEGATRAAPASVVDSTAHGSGLDNDAVTPIPTQRGSSLPAFHEEQPLQPSVGRAAAARSRAEPGHAPPATAPLRTGTEPDVATGLETSDARQGGSIGPPGNREHPELTSSPQSARPTETEIQILLRAVSLLGTDPDAALALTNEIVRDYPHGRLSEEREALAIKALAKLERIQEARARIERFRQIYPRSVQSPQLEAVLRRSAMP